MLVDLRRILGLLSICALVGAGCSSGASDAADAPGAPDTTSTEPNDATDGSASPAFAEPANPGADGIGDERFPLAGNGGYEVASYELTLDWDPGAAFLDANATIVANATEDIDAFNLDLIAMDVTRVQVNDQEVMFSRDGQELTILAGELLAAGSSFDVSIDYSGTPTSFNNGIAEIGWRFDGTTSVALGEPDGAAHWYPVNDHPSDKANYRFVVTAPSELTVAANGHREDMVDNGDGTSTWTYAGEGDQPPHATLLAIGEYELIEGGEVDGVRIRHFVSPSATEATRLELEGTADDLRRMTELLGPYPFETYGYLTVEGPFPGALETQTLTAIGVDLVSPGIRRHELAHAWFGNFISIARWDDLWMAEGFATFFTTAPFQDLTDEQLDEEIGRTARQLDGLIDAPPFAPGPGIFELFGASTYNRGGLALQAMQAELGEDLFYEVLRAFIDRHGGGVASTQDFIDVVNETSGQDLTELFDVWLFMDGLPDVWNGIPLVAADGGAPDTIADAFPPDLVECLEDQGLAANTPLNELGPDNEEALLACEP